MASYQNLNELGGPLNADYGLPFANTIANQSMSMINPVDRAMINQQATLRGQQMAEEALKASQLGNTHQDLVNRQLGIQERQWAPQADYAAMEANQKMRTLPLQTDQAVQDLVLQNSPQYRQYRDQLLMTQPQAENTKLRGEMIGNSKYTGSDVAVNLGGKKFNMTPATQKEYQDIMLKLLGYQTEEQRARMSAYAGSKPSDMENWIQRKAAVLMKQGMPQQQAIAAAGDAYFGERGQTMAKGETNQQGTRLKQLRAFVSDPINKLVDPAMFAQATEELKGLEAGSGGGSSSASQKVRVFNPATGKLE